MSSASDDRLSFLLRDRARHLAVRSELRETVLASAPGYVTSLERTLRTRRLSVSDTLYARVLAAAPQAGWSGVIAALWPFGPVWRPAAGLAAMACLGILVGLSDLESRAVEISTNGALSEEMRSLSLGVAADVEQEDFSWQD
jgi:hypothetical protein